MSQTAVSLPMSAKAQRTGDSPITWLMKLALEDPQILSLAAGFVDQQTLPADLLIEASNKVLSDKEGARQALQYGSTVGHRPLRVALANRLAERFGLENANPDCVMISNGGQQALFTVTDVVCDPGDVVLVEDPTYFVYMDVLRSAGVKVLGVATDNEGMRPDSLRERFAELRASGQRSRLRILYLMSYYSNPMGGTMSVERRREIYDVFREEFEAEGAFLLIEDASYCDLRLEGEDTPLLKTFDKDNECVYTIGTFSKAFAPGLRLGWSYGPPELHSALTRQKGNQDFGSSNLNQNIMAELLRNGGYEVAAERFRDRYRAKRDAMIAALREYWPEDTEILYPKGGLYVWAKLPGIPTDPGTDFFNRVMAEKVLYVPGFYCYCQETQGPRVDNAMRLCYGVIDIEPMREAIRRMGRVIQAIRSS